ncbi:biotin transporter BioY [Cohnella lupini]|uniref:Biotin transporter n=1 Tax=Cohnella lupini TaxID=1294267 RepID=A0A3D9IWS7_9BACL|nr:biotin transporter BioY [Cohnella lupini]RED66114.1 biotin transport system substrate-specific component [Cohnella lupini]
MTNSSTSVPTQSVSRTNNQWIRGIVYTALFGALFIVATLIKIPLGFTPIPISMGTFAIMLAGGLLGAVYGFWSIFIVVALTATGLPFIGGSGGIAKLTGPSAGYIWMYPVAAFLIGLVSDYLFAKRKTLTRAQQGLLLLGIFVFGSLILYTTGIPWLAHAVDDAKYDTLSGALKAGLYPFLAGDAIKAVVATLVIVSIRPMLPAIRPRIKKNKTEA